MMNKYSGAAVGAIALALAGMGTAQAIPAYAFAELHFQNFTLTGVVDALGNPVATIDTSKSFTTSVTSGDNANYPGFPSAGNSAGGTLATGTDPLQATSGPGAFPGENVFTQALLPANALAPAGTRGDALITGALASGATSDLVAGGKLSTTSNASSGSSTSTSLNFSTLRSTTINLTFAASSTLAAQVAQIGDSASATVGAEFRIFDATTNSYINITDNINAANSSNDIRPAALNANAATTNPLTIQNVSNPLTAYSFTALLPAGDTFQVTLTDTAATLFQGVPEPLSMTILGSGLVALGVIRRRRKA